MLCPKRSLQPDMQICGMWERLEPKGVTVSYSIHWGSLVPSNWKVPARHEKEWNSYQETSRGSRLHPTPFFGLPDADKPRRNFIKNLASWPKLVQIVPLICSKRFIHVILFSTFISQVSEIHRNSFVDVQARFQEGIGRLGFFEESFSGCTRDVCLQPGPPQARLFENPKWSSANCPSNASSLLITSVQDGMV